MPPLRPGPRHLAAQCGGARIVDGDGEAFGHRHLRGAGMGLRHMPGHPGNRLAHGCPPLRGKGADGAEHAHGVGDDIVRGAAFDLGDGDHGGFGGVEAAGQHGLQRQHDFRRHRHRIMAILRQRGMAARAAHHDLQLVGSSQHGPGPAHQHPMRVHWARHAVQRRLAAADQAALRPA